MAQDASPIDVGSTWEFTEDHEKNEMEIRHGIDGFEVVGIMIDEDGDAQVRVMYDGDDDGDYLLTAEDLRKNEKEGEIERTNAGHEAWENRQE